MTIDRLAVYIGAEKLNLSSNMSIRLFGCRVDSAPSIWPIHTLKVGRIVPTPDETTTRREKAVKFLARPRKYVVRYGVGLIAVRYTSHPSHNSVTIYPGILARSRFVPY